MTLPRGPWGPILDQARLYPSPHNSQPIKVRVDSDTTAQVFYDLDRGLPAENFGIPFGHVCAGVFLESLATVAAAHGFAVAETPSLTDMNFDATDRLHRLATITLTEVPVTDEAVARAVAFGERRTNRRPYNNRLVPDEALAGVSALAAAAGHAFGVTDDKATVRDIIRINQATLFDDLRNDAVYAEIMEWLRFSEPVAISRGDGLSARAMLMPGPVLKFAMGKRGLWEAPLIGPAIKSMYLRTMRGVPQVAWFEGPFGGPGDYLEAGRLFMKAWIELTQRGVALHPLGTVITNPRSHARFVEAAGITEESPRMAWMLFRLGYAPTPPIAHRRPVEDMVIA